MNRFMKHAIDEARAGMLAGDGGPFGAVIVKDGIILGCGHNQVIKNNDPTAHGEIMAIRNACKSIGSFDLSGCDIYTTGYPCPMCFCAILWANIKNIYYGCNTVDTEIIGFRDKQFEDSIPQLKVDICKELDRQECVDLYLEYKNIQNKVMY